MRAKWLPKLLTGLVILGMLAACAAPAAPSPTAPPPAAPTAPPPAAPTAAPAEPTSAPPAGMSGPLHILNWQGYGSDEAWALQAFQDKYGVEIVHDYYNSNEELLTKLRTSPGTYDAVLIGNTWGWQAIEEGLLAPVETAQLSNFADLSTKLVDLPEMRRGDILYGIPWDWGATGIAYNTEKITDPVDSWDIMWDPKYKGMVAWQDYFLDNVMFAAIALGQDPNKPSDLEAVKAKLIELMPQLRTFWASEDEFNKLFASSETVIGTYWSGSSARAAKMGLPLKFVVPKEGAIGWVDSWAIPKDAPHYDTALAWIDYMVSPEFYLEWDAKIGAPVPSNEKTAARLPDDSLNKSYLSQPDVIARLVFYAPLSEADKQVWVELWEEVKASQ
ncbi:MAG TPA: extracellular solute-binding protein [Anaerolineales bacterium]|nr:extracellular solute-binding protein [Anaerolineales bacterium]